MSRGDSVIEQGQVPVLALIPALLLVYWLHSLARLLYGRGPRASGCDAVWQVPFDAGTWTALQSALCRSIRNCGHIRTQHAASRGRSKRV